MVVFAFEIKVSIILKITQLKLSLNEAKLNELWASNCATYSTVLDFKICLLARKVFWPLEKRAPDTIQVEPPFLLLLTKEEKRRYCTQREWIASIKEI